jgi:hypothetical protein
VSEAGIPIIGDPSFHGWATFIVYLAVAALCFVNGRRSGGTVSGRRGISVAHARRRFWFVMTAVLLILGLTRQLDLQALLTDAVRTLFRQDGWYDDRAGLQRGLVIAAAAIGGLGLLAALVTFRRAEGSVMVALGGAVALLTFVVIRTISLHDIDHLLNRGIPGAHVNNLFEIGAIAIIGAGALAFAARLRDERRVARVRALSIQERRRKLGEARRGRRTGAQS